MCVFVCTGAAEEGSHPGQEGGHADGKERAGDQEDALQHHAEQGQEWLWHSQGWIDGQVFFPCLTLV